MVLFVSIGPPGLIPLLMILQFLGFRPSVVALINLLALCVSQAPFLTSSFDLFGLCRRWLLDGQARRTALQALKRVAQTLGLYLPIVAVVVLLDSRTTSVSMTRLASVAALAFPLVVPLAGWRQVARATRSAGRQAGAFIGAVLAHHWRHAADHMPAMFAALGVLVGLCILRWGDHESYGETQAPYQPSSSRGNADNSDLTGSLFIARLITDFWFCLSICWPLLLATTAIVLLPTNWTEHVFHGAPRPAQAEQLARVEGFTIEERHFFADNLLGSHCAVCLDGFRLGEEASRLPCRHVFHRGCVMPWLVERSGTCPTCRAQV